MHVCANVRNADCRRCFGFDRQETMTQKLPDFELSASDFDLLCRSVLFVDKTDRIVELAKTRKFAALARPPRFGKTALLSALASLFARGSSALAGLRGEALWTDSKTYPVVRLDFAALPSGAQASTFASALDRLLLFSIKASGVSAELGFGWALEAAVDPSFDKGPLERWTRFLTAVPSESVVLLIDNCDAPLGVLLNDPEGLRAASRLLERFFDRTKALSRKLRFFMTASALRLRPASFFGSSILSDVSDADLLGFSEEEVRKVFLPYLPGSEEELRSLCGGYCFDALGQTPVYSPGAVLDSMKAVHGGGVEQYAGSGTVARPRIEDNVLDYAPEAVLEEILSLDDQGGELPIYQRDLASIDPLEPISPHVLLAQAGLLSIRRVEGGVVSVGVPNRTARRAIEAGLERKRHPLRSCRSDDGQ